MPPEYSPVALRRSGIYLVQSSCVAASQKILVGLIVLVLLAFPLFWYFGWPAVFGYVVGLVAMAAYLLYLLLFG